MSKIDIDWTISWADMYKPEKATVVELVSGFVDSLPPAELLEIIQEESVNIRERYLSSSTVSTVPQSHVGKL
ncbi:hypothetical protein AAF712_009329 [Marasmius tenuissimus]|uniref:Uncharacterized protein n=1 Tax=Marasmius tenuissimus TaxID=585030 RepID=A0ABR2ZRM1_9AGAR